MRTAKRSNHEIHEIHENVLEEMIRADLREMVSLFGQETSKRLKHFFGHPFSDFVVSAPSRLTGSLQGFIVPMHARTRKAALHNGFGNGRAAFHRVPIL